MADAIEAVAVALDDGVSYADSVLERMDADPHLWAHLVRYRAVQVLREKEGGGSWRLGRDLQNSGIELFRGSFVLRVFKGQEGGPPHPGGSFSRRRFWSQMDQLAFDLGGAMIRDGEAANLILDWAVDDKRAVVVGLSKPAGIWAYQERPRVEWRIAVPIGEERMPRFEVPEEDIYIELDLGLVEDPGSDAAASE